MSLGRMGGAYAALHAGHTVADYWVQTHQQAHAKGRPGPPGRRACAAHVATLTATQAVFLAAAGSGLATGAALLDQAWHIGWCAIAAAIIAGTD